MSAYQITEAAVVHVRDHTSRGHHSLMQNCFKGPAVISLCRSLEQSGHNVVLTGYSDKTLTHREMQHSRRANTHMLTYEDRREKL